MGRQKLTVQEQDSLSLVKKFVSKPHQLLRKDFKPGQLLMFNYKAKYDKNPYDASPLTMVMMRNSKYTLGLNFHWLPKPIRIGMMKYIMSKNKTNIKKGLPLEFSYNMIKGKLMRAGGPALRKYLNVRISKNGVAVPHEYYNKVIHLRSEHFINISAEQAWKMATTKVKKRKGKS